MPLTLPAIDERRFGDLRDEALARIPVHNPEWTNFNKSDPGVTLIELFAFLTESLLYRANQIPERNPGRGELGSASASSASSDPMTSNAPPAVMPAADHEFETDRRRGTHDRQRRYGCRTGSAATSGVVAAGFA